LGELEVEGFESSRFGRRQVRTLLKILALHHDQPVGLDRLIDCLWGESPPERASDQVLVLVSRLRGVLGADRLGHTDAGYRLMVDWLDVDALREYAVEADSRLATGAAGAARAAAAAGLSLVRGPLLADEPDAWWADVERSTIDRLVARLRQAAAAAAVATEDWGGAAELASQVLAADPYDEPALRILMTGLARSGRSASALAAYAEMRERLAEDLGVSPSAETESVHTAILLGDVPPTGPGDGSVASGEDLPGRAEAIGQLDALLDRAERGQGQVGLVEGEAGIGKSHLLRVWARRAAGRVAQVVVVGCNELGRGLPLQPLLDVVDLLVRQGVSGTAEEVLGPDVAVLGPLLGVETRPAGEAQLAALTDPGAGQALLFAALFGVLRRQAEHGPLVVVVDDVHLADAATIAWLGQAVRRLADSRIVLIAARRAEEAIALPGCNDDPVGPTRPRSHVGDCRSRIEPRSCTPAAVATRCSWSSWPRRARTGSSPPASGSRSRSAAGAPVLPPPPCAPRRSSARKWISKSWGRSPAPHPALCWTISRRECAAVSYLRRARRSSSPTRSYAKHWHRPWGRREPPTSTARRPGPCASDQGPTRLPSPTTPAAAAIWRWPRPRW
jgi:DNA-binding SARP family transcriptional activator